MCALKSKQVPQGMGKGRNLKYDYKFRLYTIYEDFKLYEPLSLCVRNYLNFITEPVLWHNITSFRNNNINNNKSEYVNVHTE